MNSSIKNAIINNRLVIFTGSGFSKTFNFPKWNDLTRLILEDISLDYSEYRPYIDLLKTEQMNEIEILSKIQKVHYHKVYTILNRSFSWEDKFNSLLNNQKIVGKVTNKILTTNYDESLEKANPLFKKILHNSYFSLANIEDINRYILKLHGCITEPTTCVLFEDDYKKIYNKDNILVRELSKIFSSNTVLFVGFGMDDPYVANFMQCIYEIYKGLKGEHFILSTRDRDLTEYGLINIKLNNWLDLNVFLLELLEIKNNYNNTCCDNQHIDIKKPIKITRIGKREKFDADFIANIAFHPKGTHLAYSLDGRLLIYELGKPLSNIIGEHLLNKKIIAKSNYDIKEEIIESNKCSEITSNNSVELLVYSNEGLNNAHSCNITDISFSPDGEIIVSADQYGYLKFWSFKERKELISFKAHEEVISSIVFSPNGKLFASASWDEYIYLWEVEKLLVEHDFNPLKTFTKDHVVNHPPSKDRDKEYINSMAISRDNSHLATGDQKGLVIIRDISNDAENAEVYRKKIHNQHINSIAFSPDNNILATASADSRIRIIQFVKNELPYTLGVKKDKHIGSVNSIAFSSDGNILISSGSDKLIKLWDIIEKKLLYNFSGCGHKHDIHKVAFYPNTTNFATDSYVENIQLWEISNEGSISNTNIDFNL